MAPRASRPSSTALVLIEPEVHGDERGFLVETFRDDALARARRSTSSSCRTTTRAPARGTLRGLHFQTEPGQAKLVRCLRGADLRRRRRPAARLADLRPLGGLRARRRAPPPALRPGRLRARLLRAQRAIADVAYKRLELLRPRDRGAASPGTTPRSASSGRSPTRCSPSATAPHLAWPRSPTRCPGEPPVQPAFVAHVRGRGIASDRSVRSVGWPGAIRDCQIHPAGPFSEPVQALVRGVVRGADARPGDGLAGDRVGRATR